MWLWRRKGSSSSWSTLKAQEKAAACKGDGGSAASLAVTIGLNLGGSFAEIEDDDNVKEIAAPSENKEEEADNDCIIDN